MKQFAIRSRLAALLLCAAMLLCCCACVGGGTPQPIESAPYAGNTAVTTASAISGTTASQPDGTPVPTDGSGSVTRTTAAVTTTTAKTTGTTAGGTKPTEKKEEPLLPHKTVSVNTGKTVNSFFEGVGANIITQQWIKTNNTVDEAAWAVDVKRIRMMRPKIIRMWMEVDWFQPKKGVYDFETQRMQWLYRYLEVFREIGASVSFTYSWKVGNAAEWFGIPGLKDSNISAPADLEYFAESCSVFLREMWRRGYTNVQSLSFANEPNGGWDFECYGDQRAYYVQIAKYVDAKLLQDGIRSKVKLIGCESSDNIAWVVYCAQHGSQYFDMYTFHSYSILSKNLTYTVRTAAENHALPFYVTEFAEKDRTRSFEMGYAGYLINGANNGMAGLLNWMLHGYGGMDKDGTHFWLSQANGGDVGYQYYINSMFMNYIGSGSRVAESTVTGGSDTRSATFISPAGDTTVVMEYADSTTDRSVTINFDKVVGKTFYKHVYTTQTVLEQNAIIPPCVGTFSVQKTLKDTVDKGYSVVVYTTVKSRTQVAVDKPRCTVPAGGSVQLKATVIDNTGGVTWSVLSGRGTVDSTGRYIAAASALTGETVAVKAASVKSPDCYGVSLITIT